LQAAAAAIGTLAVQRALTLATPCTIEATRASDIDQNHVSILNPPQTYTQFDNTLTADTPWQAALLRLNNLAGYTRSLMIRGITDCVYNPVGAAEVAGAAAWNTAINAFINGQLVSGPWYIYAIDKDLTTNPRLPILDITNAIAGQLQVVFTVNHGLAAGDMVHLYNSGVRPALGTVRVQAVISATAIGIKGNLQTGWELPVTAYGRKIIKSLLGIQSGTLERITHRIVGRAFGEQRGKRRATAR